MNIGVRVFYAGCVASTILRIHCGGETVGLVRYWVMIRRPFYLTPKPPYPAIEMAG